MLQTKLYTGSDFPELLDETSGKFIKLPEKFSLEGFEPSQKACFVMSRCFWHVRTVMLFGWQVQPAPARLPL